MFGDSIQKNRRLTPKEREEDIIVAKTFKRPVREFLYDTPFYPYFPYTPLANFHLKYTE